MFAVVFAWVVWGWLGVVGRCGSAAPVLACLFACLRSGVGVVGVCVVLPLCGCGDGNGAGRGCPAPYCVVLGCFGRPVARGGGVACGCSRLVC